MIDELRVQQYIQYEDSLNITHVLQHPNRLLHIIAATFTNNLIEIDGDGMCTTLAGDIPSLYPAICPYKPSCTNNTRIFEDIIQLNYHNLNDSLSNTIYILDSKTLWSFNTENCNISNIHTSTSSTFQPLVMMQSCEDKETILIVLGNNKVGFSVGIHYESGAVTPAVKEFPIFMSGYRLDIYNPECTAKAEISSSINKLQNYVWFESQLLLLSSGRITQGKTFEKDMLVKWNSTKYMNSSITAIASVPRHGTLVVVSDIDKTIITLGRSTREAKARFLQVYELMFDVYSVDYMLSQVQHVEVCAYKCTKIYMCRGFSYSRVERNCLLYYHLQLTSPVDGNSYITWIKY